MVVPAESIQHLRHPCPANAEMASECGAVLELAGIEQCLVVVGQFHPIRAFFWGWLGFGFLRETGTPRMK